MNLFYKQYIFDFPFSEKPKKTRTVHFYFLSKETAHKPSKVATAKKLLSSVYVTGKTSSDKCFFMYVITERHLFRL